MKVLEAKKKKKKYIEREWNDGDREEGYREEKRDREGEREGDIEERDEEEARECIEEEDGEGEGDKLTSKEGIARKGKYEAQEALIKWTGP